MPQPVSWDLFQQPPAWNAWLKSVLLHATPFQEYSSSKRRVIACNLYQDNSATWWKVRCVCDCERACKSLQINHVRHLGRENHFPPPPPHSWLFPPPEWNGNVSSLDTRASNFAMTNVTKSKWVPREGKIRARRNKKEKPARKINIICKQFVIITRYLFRFLSGPKPVIVTVCGHNNLFFFFAGKAVGSFGKKSQQ